MKTLAQLILIVALALQQRPLADIAADLERLAAELKAPPTIVVNAGEDLQAVLNAAPVGATVKLADGATFSGSFTAPKTVRLTSTTARVMASGGSPALTILGSDVSVFGIYFGSALGAQTNDIIVIKGARPLLKNIVVEGNGATKRGISANGTDMVFEDFQVKTIGRVGQETQAVAMWDGTRLTMRDCFLEAGSTPFLSGGATPAVPNHVPSDILVERCTLTHKMEWRGLGYVNKTGFELKSGRRVMVRNSTIENVWVEGQTGYAIVLTPSQYGNSPETVVEDVEFNGNVIRNVGSGANILGFTQQSNPTLRANNLRFLNNTWTLSSAQFGGRGTLMQLGKEPANLVWDGNHVTQDGTTFLLAADTAPIRGLQFTNNTVDKPGTYGIYTPLGTRAGPWVATVFPELVMTGNTFVNAHSIFKNAFPANTYQVVP